MNHIDQVSAAGSEAVVKMLEAIAQSFNVVISSLERSRNKKYVDETNRGLTAIIEHQGRGEKVMTHIVKPEEADFITELAIRHHMPIAMIKGKDQNGEIKTSILYRDKDIKIFDKVLEDYRRTLAYGITELSPQEFSMKYANGEVGGFNNLTKEEIEAFRMEAGANNLEYTVVKTSSDNFKVWFPMAQKNKADDILKATLFNLNDTIKEKELLKQMSDKETVKNSFEKAPVIFADSKYPNH